jgi:NAD(P)-dependent dehydrogenase (short-subunit alcohol dehydrogenase family)
LASDAIGRGLVELHGRVALITGGGSGMGRGTARRLVAEGMRVCVVDVNGDAAAAVADEIDGLAVTADVSDSAQVDAAFTACIDAFGGVDLAYLNAGIGGHSDFGTLTDADYDRVRGVNQDHVVFGTRALIRAVRERTDGRSGGVIVATSSIAGLDPFPPDPLYTLTKHAVVGLMRALAPNLARDGITTHAICPSVTDTGLLTDGTRSAMAGMGITLVTPEQIADAVVAAATSGPEHSGTCWVVHPWETVPHGFTDVPGPHNALNVVR